MSTLNQPSERVNLFFGNDGLIQQPQSKSEDDNIYKDYVIKQNNRLWSENKKLTTENLELNQKYEELEEESEQTEKRLRNTKEFLKNFRFINDSLEKVSNAYEKINKDLNIYAMITYFRLILGLSSLLMVLLILFTFSKWILIPLQFGFVYGFHEFFVPHLQNIEQKRKTMLKLKTDKDKEIKEMTKTMDIISEFIDNAL